MTSNVPRLPLHDIKDPTDILAKMSYYLRKVKTSYIYVMNVRTDQNLKQ